MWERIKRKWDIQSDLQVALIMVVFSLAGLSIGPSRHLVFYLFGFTAETPMPVKVVTYLVCIFPLYQLYLLVFGTLLGQFRFFWNKEKKLAAWIRERGRRVAARLAMLP